MVMSIRPGMKLAVKLICVPHVAQKPRFASGDDAYCAGLPETNRTCSSRNIAQATAGAAFARRHMEQWQRAVRIGAPVIA